MQSIYYHTIIAIIETFASTEKDNIISGSFHQHHCQAVNTLTATHAFIIPLNDLANPTFW